MSSTPKLKRECSSLEASRYVQLSDFNILIKTGNVSPTEQSLSMMYGSIITLKTIQNCLLETTDLQHIGKPNWQKRFS